MISRSTKRALFLFLGILVVITAVPQQLFAGDGDATQSSAAPQSNSEPWGFKDRFHRYGFEIGIARQLRINRAQTSDSVLLYFRPQYKTRLYDLPPNRFLYRLDLVHELTFVAALKPHVAGIYGCNEILYLDLNPVGRNGRTLIYIDAGAGINQFNLRVPELTGKFQFSPQVGFGFKYRPGEKRLAYGCQLAVDHFSNNGIRRPNQGINLLRVSCGIDILPRR